MVKVLHAPPSTDITAVENYNEEANPRFLPDPIDSNLHFYIHPAATICAGSKNSIMDFLNFSHPNCCSTKQFSVILIPNFILSRSRFSTELSSSAFDTSLSSYIFQLAGRTPSRINQVSLNYNQAFTDILISTA